MCPPDDTCRLLREGRRLLDEADSIMTRQRERIAKLEAALRGLQGYGLEFEGTQTVTIALEPWREAMKVLE